MVKTTDFIVDGYIRGLLNIFDKPKLVSTKILSALSKLKRGLEL